MARPRTRFNRQQWLTIVVIGCVNFASAICISLQAPFYPQEAESKGGTATEYGLVFGIFELTAFLSCPVFGKYLDKIGAKTCLNIGAFVAGLCSVLFGLLDFFKGHDAFISLSFVTRIVESLGASAAVTASFAIIAAVFPESVATTFATLEVFYGVGYIAGPTIGGFLYVAGGYLLPFISMGIVMMFVAVLIFFLLPVPEVQTNEEEHNEETRRKGRSGVLGILSLTAVLVDALCVIAASSSMGFYSATLEPHLRQFDLAPIPMSALFVLSGGMYALAAPFVGWLCDKHVSPRTLTLAGCLLVLSGCLFVGPAPFIPLAPSLGLCILGLVIHGLGLAFLLVSCFIDALRSAVTNGFPDGLSTYGLVSGIWASSFSLGAFVGPSMSGVLFDLVGFRSATYFVIGTQVFVIAVELFFLCRRRRAMTRNSRHHARIPKPSDNDDASASLEDETLLLLSSCSQPLETGAWQVSREYGTRTSSHINHVNKNTNKQ